MLIYERGEYFEQVNKRKKKMGREEKPIMSKVNLAFTNWKKGSMQSSFKERCIGRRILVFEILNGPNDLNMDIRQQFSLSALHIQGSLGRKNCNPELGDSHTRTL